MPLLAGAQHPLGPLALGDVANRSLHRYMSIYFHTSKQYISSKRFAVQPLELSLDSDKQLRRIDDGGPRSGIVFSQHR